MKSNTPLSCCVSLFCDVACYEGFCLIIRPPALLPITLQTYHLKLCLMKNLSKLILAASLLLCLSFPVSALNQQDKEPQNHHKTIVIVKSETGIGDPFRSPAAPFDMYYQSGTIVAEFYDNIGFVSVTITNADSGETWSAILDSSSDFSTINVETENWAGCYELMIVDGFNNSYSGWFEL